MTDNPYTLSNFLKPLAPFASLIPVPKVPTQPSPVAPIAPKNQMASTINTNAPAVPNMSMLGSVQPPATPASTGGIHTVAGGDTLSSIATKNGMSLNQLLDLNPQYRVNPNLIKPGESVNISGAPTFSTQPKPTTAGGVIVNPSTGGVVTPPSVPDLNAIQSQVSGISSQIPSIQQGIQGLPPATPTPTTPVVPTTEPPAPSPMANPLFTSPEYEAAIKAYGESLPLTPEEIANKEDINRLQGSLRTAYTGEANRPIPLEFITGRQRSLENRELALEQPLQAQAALLQAKRTASLDASKFKLDTEAAKLGALREFSKPIAVSPGSSLINPYSGKTVAAGTPPADIQARDTFYNLAQTYPDAKITWDDTLTPQQNLANAQKAASASGSFEAKNTLYAINPLTGQPTLINKLGGTGTPTTGGGGAFGGTTPSTGGGLTVDNLAPELKSALNSIGDISFFDSSKTTPAQLPYLQRAAEQLGIPLLSQKDADAVQTAYQSFSSASSLIDQIKRLVANVIKAPDNAIAQSIQSAKLKAIEIAPSLSTDNDAKQFISARKSVLSLLTRAAGEKGTLTNQDVARIANALPSYGDSATLAAQKAANMTEVLQSVFSGSVKTYIGGVGGSPSSKAGTGDQPQTMTLNGKTFTRQANGTYK